MSVVGIDFGNHSCYISVARAGGIESIANDYSLRDTPSYVGFGDRQRLLGVSAKNQLLTNLKKTVFGFKHMLGRKFSDPVVQDSLQGLPFSVSEGADGRPLIHIDRMDSRQSFTPEQVTAMLLTKLKTTVEDALKTQVKDVVISCPSYFTDRERRALLDAAAMAGLNVLKLLNDTTATALAYGIYKEDLPSADEKARNVIFVDVGHVGTQVAACSFNKGKLVVKASSYRRGAGGKAFDTALVRYFSEQFRSVHSLNPMDKPRAFLKLTTEVEKVKKQMSANTNKLPLSIECFMEDRDLVHKVDRQTFEDLTKDELAKIEEVLQECLKDSEWKLDDIYSVEIVGGSIRVPAIKAAIEKVCGKVPNTTMNSDEAVSRGCALQCAILSPTFRVREFSVTDVQPFPIQLKWKDDEDLGDMVVFPKFHPVPFSKLLTFYRRDNFVLEAEYDKAEREKVGGDYRKDVAVDPYIGSFEIGEVKPKEDGSNQKVKVKVRVNLNGVFSVNSAALLEKQEVDDVPMDVDNNDSKEKENPAAAKEEKEKDNKEDEKNEIKETKETKEKEVKKKTVSKTIDLPVAARAVGTLSREKLEAATKQEKSFLDQDVNERERLNAKNAVEEYIYEIRGKINEELEEFLTDDVRRTYSGQLEDAENWLYDEGEYLDKPAYVDKLKELKLVGEAAKVRRREFQGRKAAIDSLGHSLQMASKAVEAFKSGDEKYSHLDPSEVEKVVKLMGEKHVWMEKSIAVLEQTSKVVNPPVLNCQFYSEMEAFEKVCKPILNKPKPKVEPPPPSPPAATDAPKEGQPDGNKGDAPKVKNEENMETNAPEVNGGGGGGGSGSSSNEQHNMELD